MPGPIELYDASNMNIGSFATIQAAIDAAADGETVVIPSGIWVEQLTVDGKTGLTIRAADGADVTVKAPADLAMNGSSGYWGDNVRAVIAVTNSQGVTISGIDVDGSFAGDTTAGSNGDELSGIALLASSATVSGVEIFNVSNSPAGGLFGLQHGSGLFIDGEGASAAPTVVLTDVVIRDFQKTGLLVNGVDLQASDLDIQGIGATGLTAQNGIQIARSSGQVTDSSITGLGYVVPQGGTYFYSTAVIAYEPTGALAFDGVDVTGTGDGAELAGLDLTDTLGQVISFTNGTISDATYGIYAYTYWGGDFGLDTNPDFAGTSFSGIREQGIIFAPEKPANAGYGSADGFATSTDFTVAGSQFADDLSGSLGDDSFDGGNGDDALSGGGGNDVLDGGEGRDVATYAGTRTGHSIVKNGDGSYTVTDTDAADGDSGADTLTDIEQVTFSASPAIVFELDVNSPDYSGALERFSQDFEADTAGYSSFGGSIALEASGSNGIASADGNSHARLAESESGGVFSRLGGYRTTDQGGFVTSVKVYLDTEMATGEGFDYSVAANGSDGVHQRDFIFHVAKDTSTDQLLVGGSNNTSRDPREDLDTGNHAVIATSGWYTFEHKFYENAAGDIEVAMNVYDSAGAWVFTEIRSEASDDWATEFGGNRYGWFTNVDVTGGIAIDSVSLSTLDTNPVQVFSGTTIIGTFASIEDAEAAADAGTITGATLFIETTGADDGFFYVAEGMTIQAAVNAAADGDTIHVAAGLYDEDVIVSKAVTILGAQAGSAGSAGMRDAAGGVGETTILGDSKITSTGDVTIDGVRFLNDASTSGNGPGNPALQIAASGAGGTKTVTNSIFWSTVAGGANGVDDRAFSTEVLANTDIAFTDNLISGSSTGGFNTASWGRGVWFDGGNGVDLVMTGNVVQFARTGVNGDLTGTATLSASGNSFVTNGTAFSIGVDTDGFDPSNNSFSEVGSEYNLRNIAGNLDFDLDGDIAAISGTLGNELAVVLGGNGADTILGSSFADVLDGNNLSASASDSDVLDGRDGNDILLGKGGNDSLTGGAGADTLNGGAGTDTAFYASTLAVSSFTALADIDAITAGNQPGWSVAGDDGDTLTGVERVVDGEGNVFLLVGSGGFATIQAAVNAAADGDTILVAAGSYADNVTVNKAVTILGANAGIAGDGMRGTEATLNGHIVIAADGITIDGLHFSGGASAIRGESGANAYDNLTIRNNLIVNTTDSAIRLGLGTGGGLGSENWTITDNKIDGIVGNALTGMVLFNVDGLTVTGNVIEHDLATSTGRRGINLDGVLNAVVTDNTVSMGLVAPTDANAANTASPWAIQISMSDRAVENVTVSGNSVSGATSGIIGLSQRGMVNVDISGNVIDNVVSGIVLNTGGVAPVAPGVAMDVDVTGNTVSAAINAIFVRDLHDAAANGPVTFTGLEVTGNIITSGIVQIGRLESSQPAADGLLNITGATTIDGSDNADTVRVEGTGAVTFDGGAGNDTFIGGDGDDVVDAGTGDDSINGGAGTDTVNLTGNWSEYLITASADENPVYTLADRRMAGDGTDTVALVESFVFADGTLRSEDLLNVAPTDLAFDGVADIDENIAAGTVVGTASADDANALDAIAFSLADDFDGTFAIDATTGIVTVAGAIDREMVASFELEIVATDLNGAFVTETVSIAVNDINEFDVGAPMDADGVTGNEVMEDAVNGTYTGLTVKAVDPDATTNGVTYSLTDDAGGRFAIDAMTGAVTVANGLLLNFESATSHTIVVEALSADGSTASRTFSIAVANAAENLVYRGTSAADIEDLATDDNWTVDALAGNDTINTGGGNDTFIAGAGNDIYDSGNGDDLFTFSGSRSSNGFDSIAAGDGFDRILALRAGTQISLEAVSGIDLVDASGFARVTILGSTLDNLLDFGGATLVGIESIDGGKGNDTIIGSMSDDVIIGNTGDDMLFGNEGNDVFELKNGAGLDMIDGGDGFDTIIATARNAKLAWASLTSIELIDGDGLANVTIVGTNGADTIDLTGIMTTDIAAIDAGSGNDTIIGSDSADVIKAGAGKDSLTGGLGADVFDFDSTTHSKSGGAFDVITDFSQAQGDRIDLSTIDAVRSATGDQAFVFIGTGAFSGTAGELRIDMSVPGVTKIFGDISGNGVADIEIELLGAIDLVAGDFIL